jgi:hypothetical protein
MVGESGQTSVVDIFGVVLVMAGAVVFALFVIPYMFKDIFDMSSLSSAEIVARDLGGMITISGAAPNEMTISHRMHSTYKYTIDIADRFASAKMTTPVYDMKGEAYSKTAIDDIHYSAEGINYVKIEKELTEDGNTYTVTGDYYSSR